MYPQMILKQSSNLVGRQVDDGLVLVSPQEGEVKVLNPIGAVIWHLIDGERTIESIETQLATHFNGVPAEQIKVDLDRFVTDLIAKELLVVV